MKKHILILLLISTGFALPVTAQKKLGSVSFAIMALDVDTGSRRILEDAIARRLRQNDYQVSTSYSIIRDVRDIDTRTVRTRLAEAGFDAVLVIRPVDIGREASIESVQQFLTPENYQTIAEFVEDYRGDVFNSRAVIHIVGFVLDATRSLPVWQGVMWFDEDTHSIEESRDRIVDLVEYNLNYYRPAIRQQLGFPPLPSSD